MIHRTRHIDHSSMSPRSSSISIDFPRLPSFFRSVFPSFSAAAAAAADSAIISKDEAIIFPIVILRNYSSLRSRPDVRCLRVSCRFHRDFRKVHRKKEKNFSLCRSTRYRITFALTFTLKKARMSM